VGRGLTSARERAADLLTSKRIALWNTNRRVRARLLAVALLPPAVILGAAHDPVIREAWPAGCAACGRPAGHRVHPPGGRKRTRRHARRAVAAGAWQ